MLQDGLEFRRPERHGIGFFLSVLKQDADIGRKIVVVFGDPFTSLDRFRRTCTQQLIQRLLDSAQQVIVLSHDPLFLKLLSDECPSSAANVKTLQMSKAGDTTIIRGMGRSGRSAKFLYERLLNAP